MIIRMRLPRAELPIEFLPHFEQRVAILRVVQGLGGGEIAAIKRRECPILAKVVARFLQLPVAYFAHRLADGLCIERGRQVCSQRARYLGGVSRARGTMRRLRLLSDGAGRDCENRERRGSGAQCDPGKISVVGHGRCSSPARVPACLLSAASEYMPNETESSRMRSGRPVHRETLRSCGNEARVLDVVAQMEDWLYPVASGQ